MRKNLILGGVLVVLIVMAYAYQGPLKKWQSKMGGTRNFLALASFDKIDRIDIASSGAEEKFEKKDGKWIVAGSKGLEAKAELIDGLIDEIESAGKSGIQLVSSNPERKKEFETDDSGIAVRLYEGDEMLSDLVVGKNSSDFASNFISKSGSKETYSVRGNLRKYINADLKSNAIFSSDKDKISKIRFQYPKSTFTIEKKDGKWIGTLPWKFSVNQDKAEKIVAVMSSLKAVEIPKQSFEGTGLEKHLVIVQATGEAIDNTIMVGNDNGISSYFAKKGDSDNIYLISKEDKAVLETSISRIK